MKNTLIILSHPDITSSRINKALILGVRDLQGLTIHHLDAIYHNDIWALNSMKEQELLMQHERIIFQFPFYWYSSPPMLKAYQDAVLTYGFAFGKSGNKLRGKQFKIVTTIGSADYSYQAGAYNQYSIGEYLRPFQAMANLTGMTYTPVFTIFGAMTISEMDLSSKSIEYRGVLLDENWDDRLEKYQ